MADSIDTLIIGAGLCGMSTAMHLTRDCLILEREPRPGGLAVTHECAGYAFDVTGHWLHMRDPDILARFGSLCPTLQVERHSAIRTLGRRVHYPFQSNLKNLPDDVRFRCLMGAIEAHVRREKGQPEPDRFDRYVLHHFGDGIAQAFMFPYNRKLWGVEPAEISRAWCQRFVPVPQLDAIVRGALWDANLGAGYNASFHYPRQGGIGAFSEALASQVDSRIQTDVDVQRIHSGERFVQTTNGRTYRYNHLVSTMPLKKLVQCLVDAPGAVRKAGEKLKSTSLTYLDLGLNRKVLAGQHWVYLPDPEVPAYRIGCYSNANAAMAPEGCSSLYVELANDRPFPYRNLLTGGHSAPDACKRQTLLAPPPPGPPRTPCPSPKPHAPSQHDRRSRRACSAADVSGQQPMSGSDLVQGLPGAGLPSGRGDSLPRTPLMRDILDAVSSEGEAVGPENVEVCRVRYIDPAYVIYDAHYEAARNTILSFLTSTGIQSTGRYGKWVYSSMEDALIDGRQAAARIEGGRT